MGTPKNPRPWKPGKWKMWCPVEGVVYYNDQMRQRWDGVWVGPNAELSRHPQEFLRINPEQPLPYTQPPPDDGTTASVCTITGVLGVAGYAVAECAVAEDSKTH